MLIPFDIIEGTQVSRPKLELGTGFGRSELIAFVRSSSR
jgi:hypothetical protein